MGIAIILFIFSLMLIGVAVVVTISNRRKYIKMRKEELRKEIDFIYNKKQSVGYTCSVDGHIGNKPRRRQNNGSSSDSESSSTSNDMLLATAIASSGSSCGSASYGGCSGSSSSSSSCSSSDSSSYSSCD